MCRKCHYIKVTSDSVEDENGVSPSPPPPPPLPPPAAAAAAAVPHADIEVDIEVPVLKSSAAGLDPAAPLG